MKFRRKWLIMHEKYITQEYNKLTSDNFTEISEQENQQAKRQMLIL